jgi:hypothetical protein
MSLRKGTIPEYDGGIQNLNGGNEHRWLPQSSKYGTHMTAKAIFWPGLSGRNSLTRLLGCFLLAQKRLGGWFTCCHVGKCLAPIFNFFSQYLSQAAIE